MLISVLRRADGIEEVSEGCRDQIDHGDEGAGVAQGHYAEAEPLYKRSLAISEKALGPEHPDVAQSLENYAARLRQTARADEAERMEARAKAIRAKPE